MHPILTKKKDIMSISTPNLIRKRRKREDEKKKVEGRKMSETLRKWLDLEKKNMNDESAVTSDANAAPLAREKTSL